jgi:sugar lactone lactonase YvrE
MYLFKLDTDLIMSNQKCGRPLGLRLKKNSPFLYVADAYYGIIKVDISKGTKQVVFSSNDNRLGSLPMKLCNDLDIDGDVIYFIDTSYARGVNEFLEEHVEALPRGRLFSYNEKTDKFEILVKDLYFPNGMQLMPTNDAILINENTMARIIKFVFFKYFNFF